MTMVSPTHWTSDTPIDPGWYWYRALSHRALTLRLNDHGLVDFPGAFDSVQATDLVGDWWTPRIKVPD